jgi:hypothetical protein
MKRTVLPPVLYAAALLPVVIGAHAAAAGAFAIYDHLPDSVQRRVSSPVKFTVWK